MTLWRARCAVLVYIQIHINPYQRYTFMISFLHIKLYQILLCKRNKIAVICKFFMCDLIATIDCKLWLQIQLHFGSFVILQFAWAQENYSLKAGQECFCSAVKVLNSFQFSVLLTRSWNFTEVIYEGAGGARWVVLLYIEKQPTSIVKSSRGFPPIYHFNR